MNKKQALDIAKTQLSQVFRVTPGPWAVTSAPYGALRAGPALVEHPGREAVEYAQARGRDLLAQRAADATLIAAAPDLLDMCERLLNFARYYGDSWAVTAADGMLTNAATLIAQAKGEG